MRIYGQLAVLPLLTILLIPSLVPARHIRLSHRHHGHHHPGLRRKEMVLKPEFYQEERRVKPKRPATVQVAGSSLPDCSHACGLCSPCRLVMVSFMCAEEAETCPVAYKCMCNSKSYPVP